VTDLLGQLAPDAPRGLGAAMVGGQIRSLKAKRRALDYYPTPPEATRALFAAEAASIGAGPVWEPCGRGGAIARVLAASGVRVVASDIVADPANDVAQADLMAVRHAPARKIVTNLPFAPARAMVAHLWTLPDVDYMAALFKATWLSCGKGAALWRAGLAPTRRYDLTWRLDFLRRLCILQTQLHNGLS
jgi:hypothetical protein